MYDDLPKTSAEAKAIGAKWYFTEKPCPHGHVAPRHTLSRNCAVCKGARRTQINKMAKKARVEITDVPLRSMRIPAPTYIGTVCRRGHDGTRYVSSNSCVACHKITRERRRSTPATAAHDRLHGRLWRRNNRSRRLAANAGLRGGVNHAPLWVTPVETERYYGEARTRSGEDNTEHVVDHFFPLKGRNYSGLHVPWNLHIVDSKTNAKKSNKDPRKFYGDKFEEVAASVIAQYEELKPDA